MATRLALDDDLTVIAAHSRVAPAAQDTSVGNNALAPGTRLGEFEIQGLIAEGGFGIVYVAYDHSLHRKVALKEYMPSALATRISPHTVAAKSQRHSETFHVGLSSFINEARLLARFDHPSLVKVYRFWEANGTAYMVMPLYEGVTLKDTLRSAGNPPDEAWLKTLLAQLLEALGVLHAEQCYHRDIAPDNILILRDGRPVLLDFGAARRVIGDMTQVLTVILKPGYAPIEQYAETSALRQGAWTDLYALAAVVHLAITGMPPTPSVARMVADPQQRLAVRAKNRYSPTFLMAIDRALELLPESRPQSVAELAHLLGVELGVDAANDRSMTGSSTTNLDRTRPGKKAYALFALGGAAFAIVIGGSSGFEAEGHAPLVGLIADVKQSSPELIPVPPKDPPPVQAVIPAPASPVGTASPTPQPPPVKPVTATAHAPVSPSRSVPKPLPSAPVQQTPTHKADSKTSPQRERANRVPAVMSADASSASAHSSLVVPKQGRMPEEAVTSSQCRAIVLRVSLGETLTVDDQQFMQRQCR